MNRRLGSPVRRIAAPFEEAQPPAPAVRRGDDARRPGLRRTERSHARLPGRRRAARRRRALFRRIGEPLLQPCVNPALDVASRSPHRTDTGDGAHSSPVVESEIVLVAAIAESALRNNVGALVARFRRVLMSGLQDDRIAPVARVRLALPGPARCATPTEGRFQIVESRGGEATALAGRLTEEFRGHVERVQFVTPSCAGQQPPVALEMTDLLVRAQTGHVPPGQRRHLVLVDFPFEIEIQHGQPHGLLRFAVFSRDGNLHIMHSQMRFVDLS